MKLQFTERVPGRALTVEVGGVPREFKHNEEPFEVDDAEGKALIASGYFEMTEVVRVRFKRDAKSPTVGVMNGPFRRKFVKAEEPFELTRDAWERFVEPTGHFEMAPDKAAVTPPKPKPMGELNTNEGQKS